VRALIPDPEQTGIAHAHAHGDGRRQTADETADGKRTFYSPETCSRGC
jgi:hypothetical protein